MANENGVSVSRSGVTVGKGTAVALASVLLLPGITAWFRMEHTVSNVSESLAQVSADLRWTRDEVIRLKAWREGLRLPVMSDPGR